MNNREVATINLFFMMILIVLGLVQWCSGESMPCTVMRTSVMCENAEGYFLKNVRSKNITAISFVRSSLTHLYGQDFTKFTNVSEIIIDKCEVPSRVLTFILSLTQLTVLQIMNSNIPENYFTDLQSNTLITLSIKGNNFHYIKKSTFKNFARLEEIDLSHNNMWEIQVDALEGLSALRKLDLSHNWLERFFDVNTTTQVFDNLSHLEEIDLSHNKIWVLYLDHFKRLTALRKLDISYNSLEGVFDHHAIKVIFNNFSHIEEIDLSHNQISKIGADSFEGLPALRRLDLSDNRLGDDFYSSPLSLPVGCIFESFVATCPDPKMGDHAADEHWRPAQKATKDDPLQQTEEQREEQRQEPEPKVIQQEGEQQQPPEQQVNQQEGEQQHTDQQINQQEEQQQEEQQQVNQQEEQQQEEQQRQLELQQTLEKLQEQMHQQQQDIELLMEALERQEHSGSRRGRDGEVGREGTAVDATVTSNNGGGLSMGMLGAVLLLNMVCTLLLLTLFKTKLHKRIFSALFRKKQEQQQEQQQQQQQQGLSQNEE